jgi:hypothetical protein
MPKRWIVYKAMPANDEMPGAARREPMAIVPLDRSSGQKPRKDNAMIRKLSSGKYRLYSRKKNPKTGRRRNLGTFVSRAAAARQERAVQYFKRH